MAPTEVSFALSPSYGVLTARDVHEWFLEMMQEHEEFEVETDRARELPVSFWSETVNGVVVDDKRLVLSRLSFASFGSGVPPSRSHQRPYWKGTDMAKTDALLTTPTEALISVVGTGMTIEGDSETDGSLRIEGTIAWRRSGWKVRGGRQGRSP